MKLKHASVYLSLILLIVILSFFEDLFVQEIQVVQIYTKLLYGVPLLFLLSAFLAFRINETSTVLISLSFLIMSLSGPLMSYLLTAAISEEILVSFFRAMPAISAFTLSIIFLLPVKIRGKSLSGLKIIVFLLPFLYFFNPEYFDNLLMLNNLYQDLTLPIPGIFASFLPLASTIFRRDRRAGVLSLSITASFIIFMLPGILMLEESLLLSCYLFSGIIMLHSLYRVYWENAYIDELTGLYNRRALDERLARLSKGYSIAMVDIDHFKNFNDTYGHEEGDNVLRLVAKILKDHFGASAFRYGGEEFCIIFRRKNAKDAAALMNEARLDVASHGFSIRRSQKGRKKSGRKKSVKGIKKVKLSFSSGIASPGISRPDPVEVLKNADNALYTAKNNGRNRVEITRNR